MSQAPLQWIKQIQDTLIETKAIPLSGYMPEFPWESFAEKIGAFLQTEELKITPRKTQFLSHEAIHSGLGSSYLPIALELTPLNGQAFWLMGKEDASKLAALALFHTHTKGFSSPKFQEGFYYYLVTEAIAALDDLAAFKDLSLKMGKFHALPHEQALCIDVEIQHPKVTLWGRLVCPASFHQAFKEHFSTPQPPALTSALAQQIDVSLHFEAGQTIIPLSQWKRASVGDCILLDRCSFDPQTQKGTLTLSLEKNPLFRARIKESSVKLVDYATYHEEFHPMTPHNPPSDEELSFPEFEEEQDQAESAEPHSLEKVISTGEIPLTVTVEVARIRMNLDKLLSLTPGNVLDLSVHPEQGVDLTIQGKKVAKGELVKLGEMIGVKILQLGE